MNSLAWIGIILWGLLVSGFGLGFAGAPAGATAEVQPHDVVFLVAGGFVTCLIGVAGLMGLVGWVPGLHKQQNNGV